VADSHSTQSYDLNKDALRFADYMSGVTAGEGCFLLTIAKRPRYVICGAKLVISLRDDDRMLLEKIHKFLGCGVLNEFKIRGNPNRKDQVRLVVSKAEDLANTIVPHFDRHPLDSAKKARDFQIWRKGVILLYSVTKKPLNTKIGHRGFTSKWSQQERAEFAALEAQLKAQRVYEAPTLQLPDPLQCDSPTQSVFRFGA
jgi:LAGLIDADG endonuclease